MPKVVIADTSCLILLSKIEELDLLGRVYPADSILTTSVIAKEFGGTLPPWLKISDPMRIETIQHLELEIDLGEATAIALALEMPGCTLVLDDYKAREVAKKLKLSLTGTLGLILKAKKMGVIPAVYPIIQKLTSTNFRFSKTLIAEILKEAGE